MEIDGHNGRNSPHHRVAAGKKTAVERAVADGDDPLGVRCRVVGTRERLAHVPGDRPGHEQYVGMSRRRHKTQPEALEIIERVVESVDLEFAAIA